MIVTGNTPGAIYLPEIIYHVAAESIPFLAKMFRMGATERSERVQSNKNQEGVRWKAIQMCCANGIAFLACC